MFGAGGEDFVSPDAGIKHAVGMQCIDADILATPFERSNASHLGQRCFGGGVGHGAGAGGGHIFGTHCHDTSPLRCQLQKGVGFAHQYQIGIKVDVHHFAPLITAECVDTFTAREDASVEYNHI